MMDPRIKFNFFKHALIQKVYGWEPDIHLASVRDTLDSIIDEYSKDLGMEASLSSSVKNIKSNLSSSYNGTSMLSGWYKSQSGITRRAMFNRYLEEAKLLFGQMTSLLYILAGGMPIAQNIQRLERIS